MRRRKKSLFVRLLTVMLAAGVLLSLIFAGYHRIIFNPRSQQAFRRNLHGHLENLAGRIGTPPDTSRAREMTDHFRLDLRIESGDGSVWTSDTMLPPSAEIERKHHYRKNPDRPFHFHQGRPVVVIKLNDRTYVWGFAFGKNMDLPVGYILTLTGLLVLVMGSTWLFLRRQLAPVKLLEEGTRRFGDGELEHRIPVIRSDELGQLAGSFNRMAGRIRDMMRSKDQLLLDVSHELRSPLTRIKLALEMLPDDDLKTGILQDIGQIETMVSEILETERLGSRHGGLKTEPVNLSNLVRETAAAFDGRKPGITVQALAKHVTVQADAARVRMVVSNVLENALKYSPEDGEAVEVSVTEQDGMYLVTVRDHGPGIPAADREAVFEPFYRVDKSRNQRTGGFGLGLSLCRKIMEAHGGSISAGEASGGGTEIVISFRK